MSSNISLTQEQVNECFSLSDVCRLANWPINGSYLRKAKKLIEDLNTGHFGTKPKLRKYERIIKECPVCKNEFETLSGHKREKTTCSHSCSNTFFRSGDNNPNWKEDSYRTTCFLYHKKECVVCGENNIVEVHHLDEDNKNNSPYNLIPLCPTHHQYWHSRYRGEVEPIIINYIKSCNFSL